MKIPVFLVISLFLLGQAAQAGEGFALSADKNVVMLKGGTSWGTAFLLKVPGSEPVLVTQKHVLAETGNEPMLQWGFAVGILFRIRKVDPAFYQFGLRSEVIWADDAQDIAVFQLPNAMTDFCKCAGLDPAEYHAGPARLVGYPALERRIYPHTNPILGFWRQLWGDVRQRSSSGRIFQEDHRFLGDMDALPGESGAPLLDQQGKVVGIVGQIKAEKGEGYRYRNPSLTFVPIKNVLNALSEKSRAGKNR